jgi:hypothetical protein
MKDDYYESSIKLRHTVNEYCRLHGLAPFDVSELYDLQRDYKQPYPNSDKSGVYVIYSEKGNYIGKASLLGPRLSQHFVWKNDRTVLIPTMKRWGNAPPRYVQTVATRHPYEAPSLEAYLLLKLQPLQNRSR